MKASTTAITAEDATGLRQPAINLTISLDNPHHLNSTLYNIYRATSKNGTYKLIGTGEAYYDTLSYHDTYVSPNKTYWYIEGIDKNFSIQTEISEESEITLQTSLPTPKITSANTSASGSVTIKWKKITHATKYYIYRSTSPNGTYEKIGETTTLKFADKKTAKGTTYYYKVAAVTKNRAGLEILSSKSTYKTSK